MKIDWLQRLAKWRMVFASWQLGTRPITDPECQAIRDHRELSLIMRAEKSALVNLLVKNGVFTKEEFIEQLDIEAKALCEFNEKRFPGFSATDDGMHMDIAKCVETTKGWRP